MKKHSPTCWYSTSPLGHSNLGSTVSRLCKTACIQGFHTNHSLRVTATTRLYQSGVDEQLVMERTGHRSLDGVRSYKRTSDCQREALSNILNGAKKPRQSSTSIVPAPSLEANIPSINNSTQQLHAPLSLPSAVFNNCTVNIYAGHTQADGVIGKKRRPLVLYDSDSD